MDQEMQIIHQKNFLIKLLNQEMSFRKWWKLSREFKTWIEGLTEEQLDSYLRQLKVLTQQISPELSTEPKPEQVGMFVLTGITRSSQMEPLLKERRSEAVAYFILALWKSLEVHKLSNPTPKDSA